MRRRKSGISVRIRVAQETQIAMKEAAKDYSHRLMMSYKARINNPKYFVNMDETAIYMNCYPKRTIHPKGEKAASISLVGGSSYRITLALSIAMDGTKLPFFVVFKGELGKRVEKS